MWKKILNLQSSAIDIKNKLESLVGDNRLDAKAIKNLPKVTGRQRQISGAGKGAGLGTTALLTISGTINDSNVTFMATEEPSVMIINGPMYRKTGGSITWSWSSGTIVLSTPVGNNGFLFGIR